MRIVLSVLLAAAFYVAGAGGRAAVAAEGAATPELKKLDFLTGKSSSKGKMFLPGQAPADWTSRDSAAWMKGGNLLKTESTSEFPGLGADETVEFMAYDKEARVYRFWRFSSMEAMPTEASGNFEGNRLVMVTKPYMGQVYRATWEPKPANQVYFLLEMKAGDSYQKLLESTSTPTR
jgi:hypothetical protein